MSDARPNLAEGRMSAFQIVAIVICMAINMLDGFDVLAIAFAGPPIAQEWALSPQALGLLFSAGPIGMMIGSILISPVADVFDAARWCCLASRSSRWACCSPRPRADMTSSSLCA